MDGIGRGSVSRRLEDSRYSRDGESLDTIPYGDTNRYVKKVLETLEARLLQQLHHGGHRFPLGFGPVQKNLKRFWRPGRCTTGFIRSSKSLFKSFWHTA